MSNSYYTQTKNFLSSVNDEVDPRTGLYSVSLNLGNIIGNNGNGPEIPLSLSYSPTSDSNIGFGIGLSTALTVYDSSSKRLNLNTGEQYVINETGSTITVNQMKLKTFVITKSSKDYIVVHKNGTTEVLGLVCQNLYLPKTIIGPFGHSLTLQWDGTSGVPQLVEITDMDKEIHCSVAYKGKTTFSFLPGKSEQYTVTLTTESGFLSSITHEKEDEEDVLTWDLNYTSGLVSGINQTLTGMTTPLGLKKSVKYTSKCMNFPKSSGLPALPAVSTYTIEPGMGQKNLERTYTYSPDQNYLGYGASGAWAANSDFTYTLPSSYQYYSIETVVDPDTSAKLMTQRFYNHYHLMILSEEKQGGNNKETALTYYEEAGKTFDQQPAQLQCLKQQKVTWIDSNNNQYSETTNTEYDENGNLIKQIDPSGTVTEIDYYPATGESDSGDVGCPADPHGFVRFVKSRKVTPASTAYDAPVQLTYGKFGQVVTLDTTSANYNIVPVKMTRMRDGVSNLVREMEYFSSTGDTVSYGRLKSAVIHLVSPEQITSENTFSYKTSDESLTHTRTFTGHDGCTQTSQREHSRFTQKVWSFINTQEIKTELSYDWLGRIIRRVINPDNDYMNELNIAYEIQSGGGKVTDISVTYTDNEGNAHRKNFDSMGRVLTEWVNNKDKDAVDYYQVKAHLYDACNRLQETQNIDYKDPADINTKMLMTQNALFDDWGQNYLNKLNSGQQNHSQFDPVTRDVLEQLQITSGSSLKLGSQSSHYNSMNLVETTTKMAASGAEESSQMQQYDGLGRVREHTDALKNKTQYTYDEFDRVLTQTLADGTVVTKTYDENSTDELITSISVTPKGGTAMLLGTQEFDGLGRLTMSTSGGRTQTYTYTGPCTSPSSSLDSMSNSMSYTYVAELDDAVTVVKSSTGNIDQSFVYEHKTGRMLEANEKNGQSKKMVWWPTGELEQETFLLSTQPQRQAGYEWTLQGQPLKYTDVAGNIQTLDYDAYGRVVTITDPQVTVTITYDAAGRVSTQNTVAPGGDTLLTTLTWDDFSREIQRNIQPSNGNALTLVQTYTLNDLMESRTTTYGTATRTEGYTYDVRNRLTRYDCQCNGSIDPVVDGYGQPITSQTFTLDALSNITKCVTVITGGNTDTALYFFENPQDPTQLTRITHTFTPAYPSEISLQYDANGRMTKDEAGRLLSYDETGRLIKITDSDHNALSTYGYDAMNTLVMQTLPDDDLRQLFYAGTRLVSEASSKTQQISRYVPGTNGSAAVSEENFAN